MPRLPKPPFSFTKSTSIVRENSHNRMMSEKELIQDNDQNGSMIVQSKFRPSPKEFQCGEELEEGVIGKSGVSFFCTLPKSDMKDDGETLDASRLTFSCRDRSSGVLESEESAITNDEFEATQNATAVDPFFFDPGYTLAGRTGFQVWSVSA